MNNIKIFENKEFGEIRTVVIDGKFYAVGVDVARALGYSKPAQAVIDHCKGIRKLGIPSEGGVQETNCIPEGDMYRLVVKAADQSKNSKMKNKAGRFEKWIFDEVLPLIRQTGKYELENEKKLPCPLNPIIASSVADLGRVTERIMKNQGSAPYKIAEAFKLQCEQFGIKLPEDFVKIPEYEQMTLSVQ